MSTGMGGVKGVSKEGSDSGNGNGREKREGGRTTEGEQQTCMVRLCSR
jgi:hypothetical protein